MESKKVGDIKILIKLKGREKRKRKKIRKLKGEIKNLLKEDLGYKIKSVSKEQEYIHIKRKG